MLWEVIQLKTRKMKKRYFVLVVGVLICLFFLLSNVFERRKIELLKQEYFNMLEESIANAFDDPTCKEYRLAAIDYDVTDLIKQKDASGRILYNVRVVIDCTSHDPDCSKSSLAYAVEDYVPSNVEMSTGDIITLRNNDYRDDFYGDHMLTVNINGERIHGPEPLRRSTKNTNNKKVKKCRVCGREFEMGTDDSMSITNTNMCRQCYKNYKYAKEELSQK